MFVPQGVFNREVVENNVAKLLATSVEEHVISVEFSCNTQRWQCWHFCIASTLNIGCILLLVTLILI